MNVIFLDFDGVLDTIHYNSMDDIERRIKVLSDICSEFNCKVVIEASAKDAIDEETMCVYNDRSWVKSILNLFDKYDIECIGRTPNVEKDGFMWKEDEIRLYLYRHPEIEHYCIIDDDDLAPHNSDLNKVRNHLVKTIYYSANKEEEGLLEKHKSEVGDILKLDNDIKKLILRKQRIKK